MHTLLNFIAANGVYALAVGVFLGIIFPSLASTAKPLMVWSIGGLLILSLVRVDWRAVKVLGRRFGVIFTSVLFLLILSPLMVWALAGFSIPNSIWLAVILMSAAPPITSSPAMVALVGLDADLSLVILIASSMLAPFSIAAVCELIGIQLTISTWELFVRLLVFIGVCTVASIATRSLVGVSRLQAMAQWLNVLAVVLLLVFAVAIMDGVWYLLVEQPAHVIKVTLIAIGANVGLLLIGSAVMFWCGMRQALTVGFSAANCNMGTLWAVLPDDTPQDVFLYFALAQIPMYLTPALLRYIWRRSGRASASA